MIPLRFLQSLVAGPIAETEPMLLIVSMCLCAGSYLADLRAVYKIRLALLTALRYSEAPTTRGLPIRR